MHDFPFVTQKQLGEVFGVSNLEMGRLLQKIGFRDQHLKIRPEMFAQGICQNTDGITGWNRERTIAALEKAGFKRPIDRATLPTGPFKIESEGGGKCLLDSSGNVCMRVYGDEFGEKIAEVMRLAFEKGGMFCDEWWDRVCPRVEESGKRDWRDHYENM
ncbi:hypothetical protein [Rubinisphaera italica]|uniref:Uncharacterized protein n=1 Tax=Rubinisphaera italica TaxID=2527969 RepID=A0A5C5XJ81_9PLAN|nr:hypothetical protein [Rubinisphaera italica]TWT62874.1 hypothetical protein Pan54_36200 [Rubinisphaera italica]